MGKQRRPETDDSQDETLPGDDSDDATGLGPEVLALTDHSDTPLQLERDTVRDGVFVNLGRAFDSAPPVESRPRTESETENNRTLQYAKPLHLDSVDARSNFALSPLGPEWDKRTLPLAPLKADAKVDGDSPGPRPKRVSTLASTSAGPTGLGAEGREKK